MNTIDDNRLQSLIESQTSYVIRTDLTGHYTFYNKKYEEVFGWVHNGDLNNKLASDTIAPHHRDRANEVVLECVNSPGKIIQVELDKLTQNDGQRTSLWEFVCVADRSGNPFEIQCTGIDITDIKIKEAELKKQAETFQNLFDTMTQGVVYQNADGYITNANKAAQRILGLSLDQLQGKTSIDPDWRAIKSDGSDFPGTEHPAMVALRTGKTIENVSMGIYHPDKDDFVWINVSAVPEFRDNETTPYRVYATFTDVTENRSLLNDLKKQNQIQELMTELSTSFINMPIEEIDHRINEAIASIGEFVNGDRVYIIEYDFINMVADNSYEWCAKDIEPQIDLLQGIPVDAMPEWLEAHLNGRTLIIPDVLALPPDDYTRSILEPQGIKSLIAIPMMDGDNCIAFVGIDSVRNHHTYTKFEEIVLRIFADMIVNVRKREQTLDALANSEKQNRDILEVSPVGIGVIQDNKLVYVNPKGCEMLGADHQKLLVARDIRDFVPAESTDMVLKLFSDIKENRDVTQPFEIKLRRLDDSLIPIEFSAQLMNYNGKHAYQIIAVDITTRKQVEEQLKLLSQSIEQSPVYIVITDKNGAIEYVNPSFTENVGYSITELMGQNPRIWKSGLHDREFYKSMWDTVISGKQWQGEICNKKRNGELYWEKTMISPVADESGKITHFISVKEDITQKKQAEEDRLAKQEAEAKSKAKSLFLSNMSHEIRTPLNAVIGFSQLLENDRSLTKRQSEYVYNITRSSKHLLSLIEDILDYTRLEANRMSLNKTSFLIRQLANDVKLMFEYKARDKGIELALAVSANLPEVIESDEAKVRQILINLVGNAVKFTDHGKVSLEISAMEHSSDTDKVNLHIVVKDTGPGIAKDDLKHIFEEFRQFEPGYQKGGTGLGMPISKRLVELLGGSIEITSQVGVGTEIKLNIPVQLVEAGKIETVSGASQYLLIADPKNKPRILIVDDNKENQMLLWYMLKNTDMDLKKASSGVQALSILENWVPDCVLLDIRMSEMNGLEVAERIRKNKKFESTKVIAVSASRQHSGKDVTEQFGIDGFLLKPVNQQILFETLQKVLNLNFKIERKSANTRIGGSNLSDVNESLKRLSDDEKMSLIESIKSGDTQHFNELIDSNKTLVENIKLELIALVETYEYEKILTLLGENDVS